MIQAHHGMMELLKFSESSFVEVAGYCLRNFLLLASTKTKARNDISILSAVEVISYLCSGTKSALTLKLLSGLFPCMIFTLVLLNIFTLLGEVVLQVETFLLGQLIPP